MRKSTVENAAALLLSAKCRLLSLCLIAVLLTNCALEGSLSGGEQDKEPPKVKQASPPNGTVLFRAKEIRIRFDEYIKSGSFPNLLVSPPMDKDPVVIASGKTLVIKLKSPLLANTTYTISLGDDVQDINEGNAIPNFTFTFSTGLYLDSLSINGAVVSAADNEPMEKINIQLYKEEDRDSILTRRPLYFAKTDKSGVFKIEHIKEGNYYIHALKDQNFSFSFDQPNEQIAFFDSIIKLDTSKSQSIALRLFEEKQPLTLLEAKEIALGHIRFIYNGPVETFGLESKVYQPTDTIIVCESKDTLHYFFSNLSLSADTFRISADETRKDTLRLELSSITNQELSKKESLLYIVENQSTKMAGGAAIDTILRLQSPYESLKIAWSRPLHGIDNSKAVQIHDDSTGKTQTAVVHITENTRMQMEVDFLREANHQYTISLPDSMLHDKAGNFSTHKIIRTKILAPDAFGDLHLNIKTKQSGKSYLLLLLNESKSVVRKFYVQSKTDRRIDIMHLQAGNYTLRAIDDRNSNGQWDTGDFKTRTQPEQIIPFKETHNLKGGWDLEIDVPLD